MLGRHCLPHMFSIEPFEFFARLCADVFAYSYSFNAIFADAASPESSDGTVLTSPKPRATSSRPTRPTHVRRPAPLVGAHMDPPYLQPPRHPHPHPPPTLPHTSRKSSAYRPCCMYRHKARILTHSSVCRFPPTPPPCSPPLDPVSSTVGCMVGIIPTMDQHVKSWGQIPHTRTR